MASIALIMDGSPSTLFPFIGSPTRDKQGLLRIDASRPRVYP